MPDVATDFPVAVSSFVQGALIKLENSNTNPVQNETVPLDVIVNESDAELYEQVHVTPGAVPVFAHVVGLFAQVTVLPAMLK